MITAATSINQGEQRDGEWFPEVIGTPSGAVGDYFCLAEKCAAGCWPSQAEAMRILNAAGRTISDLVATVGTLRPSKPSTAPAPVVANGTTIAEQNKEIGLLQQLENEFSDHQVMIAKLGVTRAEYLESRMKSELSKRGIDPRKIGLSR